MLGYNCIFFHNSIIIPFRYLRNTPVSKWGRVHVICCRDIEDGLKPKALAVTVPNFAAGNTQTKNPTNSAGGVLLKKTSIIAGV